MIWFSQRMAIERAFNEWAEENGIAKQPNSLVAFLQINDCLDEEQVYKKFPMKKLEVKEAPE